MVSEHGIHEVTKVTVSKREHKSPFPFHATEIKVEDAEGNATTIILYSQQPLKIEVPS